MRRILFTSLLSVAGVLSAQAGLQKYHTGDPTDYRVEATLGGLLLLGGGGDVPEADRWLMGKAQGGDVVVLRASGSDGYNDYFYREVGVPLHSVTSWVVTSREAAHDPELVRSVRQAEVVFLAGGDQSRYVEYWKDTPLGQALNAHLIAGKPLGGTSAGLAVMGEFAYSARHPGSLQSAHALKNPFQSKVTLEAAFLKAPLLEGVITDSHFNERARLGRLIAFVARLEAETGREGLMGLGIDERTALAIETDGSARVFRVGQGTASLVMLTGTPGTLKPDKPLAAEALVIQLGPDSQFNLRSRAIDAPVAVATLQASRGKLKAAEPAR